LLIEPSPNDLSLSKATIEDSKFIDTSVDIIFGIINGLELFSSVDSSQICFNEVSIFSLYNYLTIYSYQMSLGLETTLNFTNSLGNLSPMLRNCNMTSGELALEIEA
jgi:hypothetical protein